MGNKSLLSCVVFLILINGNLFSENEKADSLELIVNSQNGIEKAQTLNKLSHYYLYDKTTRSIETAKEALNISKEKDYTTEIKALSNLMEGFKVLREYDSSDMYAERGLELSKVHNDTVFILEFSTNTGWRYCYLGDYNISKKYFSEALTMMDAWLKNHPDNPDFNKLNYAKLLNNKATVYYKIAYYDSALMCYKLSLNIRLKNNAGPKFLGPSYQNIGGIYFKNKDYQEASEYFNKAFEMYEKTGDTSKMASVVNNMGLIQNKLGDTTAAIEKYNQAFLLQKIINNTCGQIKALNNLSSLYLNLNHPEKAYKKILLSIDLNKNSKYKSDLCSSYQNLGNYYLQIGNYSMAIEYLKMSLGIAKKIGKRNHIEQLYLSLSEAYEKSGNFKLSLEFHKRYKQVYDSIFNDESQKNYEKLYVQLETEQKQRHIEKLENEKEKQTLENEILRYGRRITIVILLIIIISVFLLIWIIFIKRKKDKQIHRQKELFLKKKKELAQLELEKSKIKEVNLQQSVVYKSKQLSTHALHMMQKNKMLQEIQIFLKEISKSTDSKLSQDFTRINKLINQSLKADKDWDVFKLYFEEINKDFYTKLKNINSELTINDHRLCALIKLNMSSKEMASVLNVAPNSIKSSRYRLKKKIGLDIEANLEEYIRNI